MNSNNNSTCVHGMRYLQDDPDRYSDVFINAFRPNSEDVESIQDWLRIDFEHEVVDRIAPHFEGTEAINVMGVGTADGSMDRVLIGTLRQHFGKLRYTVVEPGPSIEEFKGAAAEDERLNDVTFDWRNLTLEDFYAKRDRSDSEKFAFISCIHSVYYFDNVIDSLSRCMGALTQNGALMLIVNSDDNTFARWLAGLPWKAKNVQYRLVPNITDFARSRNIPLFSVDIPGRIDITSCFDESSEEGGKLLDFLVEIAYFRETAPHYIFQKTMDDLRALAVCGSDGKQYIDTNCKAMIMLNK